MVLEVEKIMYILIDLNFYYFLILCLCFVLFLGIVKKNIDVKKIFLELKCVGLKDGRVNKVVFFICYLFIFLYKNK